MYTISKKVSKGLVAAALAFIFVFGASAFKGEYKRDTQRFRYNGPDHTEAEVEKLSNWINDSEAPACNEVQQQACVIVVDDLYVNPDGSLKSTLNLAATEYTPSSAYVSGSSDFSMQIENRTAQ